MRPRTLIGKPSFITITKECPAPNACALRMATRFKIVVIAIEADQALARGFVEGNPEFHLRSRIDDGLVEIFHGFDEVARAKDEIAAFRYFQSDRAQLHAYNCIRATARWPHL